MPTANNEREADASHLANLKRMAYFAAVVETGSFTAAAERLGITKAVVSQQVARLEREFRTTLLTRTTRRVTPTDAGRAFHARCALVLKEAHDAFDELGDGVAEPRGTLRLTAALDYGITTIVPAITEFTRRYPLCQVDAILSDQSLDVMSGQVELAIRVGWLTEPGVQARQIGAFRQLLVAAPGWREPAAALEGPQDLARLPFVAHTALHEPTRWTFSRGALEHRSVALQAVVSIDATLAVREAVRLGAGLSVLPDYAVAEDIALGRLVHVLPQWTLPSGGIHAVFPPARFRPAKVRAFVDLLQETATPAIGPGRPGGTPGG